MEFMIMILRPIAKHDGAIPLPNGNQPLALQDGHSLAHRGAADMKHLLQLRLGWQYLAGMIDAGGDIAAKLFIDGLVDRDLRHALTLL